MDQGDQGDHGATWWTRSTVVPLLHFADERKVESILIGRAPRSVKDIQIFIGFANFYQKFIENFSKICKPITHTLKGKDNKGLFIWGKEQDEAFEELKRRITSEPILAHFYPER